ncbi:hypothetical protein HDU80_007818 [Chytriomyces hyalinus]|nr:hypothetical protein HDU80_007818 [Chytriomyces hyalinus]
MPNIRFLNVANNKFTGRLNNITWLADLEFADLSFNELSGGIRIITRLKKLKHLFRFRNINNNFDGAFNPQLQGSLTSLRLNNNRFSGIFNMENLTLNEIDIYGNLFQLEPAKKTAKESDDQSIRNSVKMKELFPTGAHIISKEYGFLPRHLCKLMYPNMEGIARYKEWSVLISQLPNLLLNPSRLRDEIDKLPRLTTTKDTEYHALLRVSCMASNLCHVYHYHGNPQKVQPPQNLKDTWLEARASLQWSVEVNHRQETDNAHYLTYMDFIVSNCQPADSTGLYPEMPAKEWIRLLSDPTNLRVLVPTAPVKVIVPTPPGPNQEDTFYMVQTSMLAVSAGLPALVAELQMLGPRLTSKAAKVGGKLKEVLYIVRNVTAMFERISLHEGNVEAVTSLFFGRMFASTVIPAKFVKNPETGQYDAFRSKNGHLILTPGPGGQASPFFALMDSFLNRKHYGTNLGHHSSLHMNSYPADWRNFLMAVRSPHKHGYGHFEEYLRSFPEASITGDLEKCFDLYSSIVEAYLGDNGLLARHLLKLHGYLTGMFRTGREGTIGDAKAGSILNHTEDVLYKSIESSRLERLKDSLPPYSRMVSVQSFEEVSEGSKVWNLRLNVPTWCHDEPEAGGHILLHPKNIPERYEHLNAELVKMSESDQTEIMGHLISNGSWLRHFQLWRRKIDDTTKWNAFLELGDLFGVDIGNIKSKIRSLMPLRPRIYSIAFAPRKKPSDTTKTVSLFIRTLDEGVVFRMLTNLKDSSSHLFPVVVPVSPPLLPTLENSSKPIVLFSAGTGISPFLSVIEKAKLLDRDIYFVWFTNICSTEIPGESLEGRLAAASEKPLDLSSSKFQSLVVCTSKDHSKRHKRADDIKGREFHVEGTCQRDHRMTTVFSERSNHLKHLKSLINNGGDIRVCGSSGFVNSVITFLESPGIGHGSLGSWIGSGRLKVEAFSSREAPPEKEFEPHQILASVRPESMPLMVLNGGVYKVTQQLKDIHPGGAQIFDFYLGTDGSRAFNQIKHNVSSKVLGMMQPYQVGQLVDATKLFAEEKLKSESMRVLKTDYDQVCKRAWSMMEIRNAIRVEYELHVVLDSMGNKRDANLHAAEAYKSYSRFTTTHLPVLNSLFPESCKRLPAMRSFENHPQEYFQEPKIQEHVQERVCTFLDVLVEDVSNLLEQKSRELRTMLLGGDICTARKSEE